MKRILAAVATISISLAALPPAHAKWGSGGVVVQNPTKKQDQARKIVTDGTYVYAAGVSNGVGSIGEQIYGALRLVKFNKSTGAACSTASACADGVFGVSGAVTENVSGQGGFSSLAVDGNSIYLVGLDSSTGQARWRLEKRSKITGALRGSGDPEGEFGSGGVVAVSYGAGQGYAIEVKIDGDYVYIAGTDTASATGSLQWHVEKRNKRTGALCDGTENCADGNFATGGIYAADFSDRPDEATALTLDANYLYVAGYDTIDGDMQTRVAKFNKVTGALCDGVESCADGVFGTGGHAVLNIEVGRREEPFDVRVDGGYLYLVGHARNDTPEYFAWVAKRNAATGALCDGAANCAEGNFATGGIVMENDSPTHDAFAALALDAEGIYAVGVSEYSAATDQWWAIHKYDRITGARCSVATPCGGAAFGDNGSGRVLENPSLNSDIAYSVTTDGTYLYVAGYDARPGKYNWQWRIERRLTTTGALAN